MKSMVVPIVAILYCSLAAAEKEVLLFDQEFGMKLPPFAKFNPDKSLQFAEIISDKCLEELVVLSEDSGLKAAAAKIESSCPPQTEESGSTVTITADYSSCSATGDYQLACTSAGGKVSSVPAFSMSCNVSANGRKGKVSAYSYDAPECMGQSCNESVFSNKEFHAEFKRELESALRSQGISANCDVGNKSPATVAILNKITMLGGFVVLLVNALG